MYWICIGISTALIKQTQYCLEMTDPQEFLFLSHCYKTRTMQLDNLL